MFRSSIFIFHYLAIETFMTAVVDVQSCSCPVSCSCPCPILKVTENHYSFCFLSIVLAFPPLVWLRSLFFFLLLQVKQQFGEFLDQLAFIESRLVSRIKTRKNKKWRMHQLAPWSGTRSPPVSHFCEFVPFLGIRFHLIPTSVNLRQFLQTPHEQGGAR